MNSESFTTKLKSLALTTAICAAVAGAFLIAQAIFESPNPVIVCFGAVRNFGDVHRGIVLRQRVQVVNISPRVVEMYLMPSCGCTTVAITANKIQPWSRQSFDAKIDTDDVPNGKMTKSIDVQFWTGRRTWSTTCSFALDVKK